MHILKIFHIYKKNKENLRLAKDLAQRDLSAKYRRSNLGLLWLIVTPLSLLGVYSLVFGQIFGIKWETSELTNSETVGFALPFFVGLSIYLVLSDIVNSSTVLMSSKRSYVVRSSFPLWVLWLANLIRGGVHALVAFSLVLIMALIQQRLTLSGVLWGGVSLISCSIFISGMSLLLVSIGGFIGDISDVLKLVLRLLFYATPITYPLMMVPMPYQNWMWFNPLTSMVELVRIPIVFGVGPPMSVLIPFTIFSIVLLIVSVFVFRRVKGFIADVV